MKKYWSKKAAESTPYTAGEQPKEKLVKLNTNENAYPPSPKVAEAVAEATRNLRRYPHPDGGEFRAAAAEYCGVREANIFCANGSDEALALCFLAFFDPGVPVKTLDVTYSFYPVWARLFGVPLETVPLLADYSADVPALCGGKGVILANPNAPTGVALPLGQVEQIVRETDGVAVVDEAYFGFGAVSAVSLTETYQNLAVVRTLSKSHSLAGLRAGFVVADENLVGALTAVKDSFNSYPVDMLAQAGAAAALRDAAYAEENAWKVSATRDETIAALADMGVFALPSAANFFLMRCENAEQTFAGLRRRGILVRHFSAPRTRDFLRVTVGTPGEMRLFLKAMEELL